MSHKRRGFTLIEIIAVLLILAVIAVVALPRAGSNTANAKAIDAANELKSVLRYAQLRALNETGYTWTVTVNSGSYTLSTTDPLASANLPGTSSPTRSFQSGVTASTTGTASFNSSGLQTGTLNSISIGSAPAITITANTGFIP